MRSAALYFGFISGSLGKKMGLTVVSFKSESGERGYRLA